MQRFVAAAPLVAAAVLLWFATFYGVGWTVVWLVETYEGDTSECWWAECGTFGEFLDDHDLFAVIVLGVVAALPPAAVLWKGRSVFAGRTATPPQERTD